MTSNSAIISAHYAASSRGDLTAMVADFDPQITWVEAAGFPLAGTYIGTEAVINRVFQVIAADWEGFAMVPEELFESGDTVIVVGHYVGTHRRTGHTLQARAVHLWRLRNGTICAFEQLTDTLLVAQAISAPASSDDGS